MVTTETDSGEGARSLDRSDPQAARGVFERLYPDRETRERLIEILADSVETAHRVNPSSWSVTLGTDRRRVTLNAGRIFVLYLEPDEVSISLTTQDDELEARLRRDSPKSVAGAFDSLPGVGWYRFKPSLLLERWDELRESHLEAVERAAGQLRRSPYYRSYSPGVLRLAGKVVGRSLPEPDHADQEATQEDVAERLVSSIRSAYPGWSDFEHPAFAEDETHYKRKAVDQARELLAEDQLRDLLEAGRFGEVLDRIKKLAQSTNFLYQGTPSSGDLAVLHVEDLDEEPFCRAFTDLLYGPGESPERLEEFTRYLEERGLPNKWTFPTYLLFFRFPETDYFIKPSVTRWFLRLVGAQDLYKPQPDGTTYTAILDHVRPLLEELRPYGARDMVDVQSAIWVAHRWAQRTEKIRPKAGKRQEMESLFPEFVRDYLSTEEGRQHSAACRESRERGQANYREILAAREAGEDVTDRVLLGLLPHTDTAAHRESGAWIHVAPAITGDLKSWFEATGWREPGDWQEVAQAILSFVERCVDNPSDLESACEDFDRQPWSTGFQTGMLTPILNALRPDDFLLVNNKSRRLINYLSGQTLRAKLVDYPDLNRTGQVLVEDLADLLESAPADIRTADVFDAFSHWLVAIRKFPFGRAQYWKVAPGEGARYWDDCLEGGFISMGWNEIGDLSKLSREEYEEKRDELVEEYEDWNATGLEQLWKFAKEIREGDRIVANEGTTRVLGFGTVTGPYHFIPDVAHSHRLPVDWDDTEPRQVQEGGWRRTLVQLDRDKFNALVDAPADTGDQADRLTRHAFDLLEGLFENPTRDYYSEHRDRFKRWLETPFQELMGRVIALLPEEITDRMETEKNVFGRIPKNDYGRGGAWPFYWGALYPRGGRRIEDAQLSLWINHDRLEAGFYIGEYGSESNRRFLKSVNRLQEQLPRILREALSRPSLVFGERELYQDEQDAFSSGQTPSWREWLKNPAEAGVDVSRIFRRQEVLDTDPDELAQEIAATFQELFPLVLLCTEDEPLELIRRYLRDEEEAPRKAVQEAYPLPECASELKMELEDLERWVRAIHRKEQAILYGPPGTGKTHVALHLARHLVGGGDGFTDLVQFHPSYAYEDFIQGIRPEALPEGGLDYPLKRGRFLDFCDEARKRDDTCVLIIDEINRANLSRVFGELMYLLEYRDRKVDLAAGGEPFSIPKNVRILGTMNTADRSIALVDHALRRRFAFLHLGPSYDTLRRFHEGNGFDVEPLIDVLRDLNQAIDDPHYEVGITFFLHEELPEHLEDIWRMEIYPYLEEHFHSQPEALERFRWDQIKTRVAL